ncbi:P-loop NTPase fold protein [Chitinophaga sp.]|uniref:P-loop NTPase fold protein n=1 Tax=Chitinophaga sp. TaxID=1869181 RepID=UPI0031D86E18
MEINIATPSEKFSKHLDINNNKRILFSGRFGIGKSYFLKKYYENNNSSVFYISPINYVVGANQDIFEWIKIDIAKLLIEIIYDQQEPPTTEQLAINTYVFNNAGKIFVRLLRKTTIKALSKKLEEKTGINIEDIVTEEIEEYKNSNEHNRIGTELSKIEKYITDSLQFKGSIYERDLTTHIICECLQRIKNANNQENILIIDDLDRLDPEHIFRILNILSAHNDHLDNDKFGFDKVIIVCDKNNLESLFKHRYGDRADFEGYIEKFYSFEPFHYSLSDSIITYCENNHFFNSLDDKNKSLLKTLLIGLFKAEILKIRNLRKINNFSLKEMNVDDTYLDFKISTSPGLRIHETFVKNFNINVRIEKDLLYVLNLLKIAFGGVNEMLDGFNKLKNQKFNFPMEEVLTIYSSILIPSHISKMKSNNVAESFFHWQGVGSNGYNLVSQSNPYGMIGKNQFEIPLKWSPRNPYNKGDYFEGINYEFIFNRDSLDNMKEINSYSLLADELSSIVRYFIK